MRQLAKPPVVLSITPRPLKNGGLPEWSRKTRRVQEFVQWALTNQLGKCAFCGYNIGDLAERRAWSVDHFAPKSAKRFPQWTYEVLNLVVTCHSCNSVFKKEFNTVSVAAHLYTDCTFALVHPYLDVITDHMTGTYGGGVDRIGAPVAVTDKGRETIAKFRLSDASYISAINGQALRISIDEWKARLPGSARMLFRNALAELSGRWTA
jgi:uncharacterized protein (TIGR02646 family)